MAVFDGELLEKITQSGSKTVSFHPKKEAKQVLAAIAPFSGNPDETIHKLHTETAKEVLKKLRSVEWRAQFDPEEDSHLKKALNELFQKAPKNILNGLQETESVDALLNDKEEDSILTENRADLLASYQETEDSMKNPSAHFRKLCTHYEDATKRNDYNTLAETLEKLSAFYENLALKLLKEFE